MERFASNRIRACIGAVSLAVILAGCDDDNVTAATSSAHNRAPRITGNAPKTVSPGQQYFFKPFANDADGDRLTFSVTNRPKWLTLSAEGTLSGTPAATDVGTYAGVMITVTDGKSAAALSPFTISVQPASAVGGSGAVTLSLTPPTETIDGTPLWSSLAGYRIYWGTSIGQYPHSATIQNPGVSTYVVENLASATWYFVATVVTTDGVESDFSDPVSVVL